MQTPHLPLRIMDYQILKIPLPSPESHDVERPLTAHAPFDRVEEELGAATGGTRGEERRGERRGEERRGGEERGEEKAGGLWLWRLGVCVRVCVCVCVCVRGCGCGIWIWAIATQQRSPNTITIAVTRSAGSGSATVWRIRERTREQKGLRCGNSGGCRGARSPCDRRPQQLSSQLSDLQWRRGDERGLLLTWEGRRRGGILSLNGEKKRATRDVRLRASGEGGRKGDGGLVVWWSGGLARGGSEDPAGTKAKTKTKTNKKPGLLRRQRSGTGGGRVAAGQPAVGRERERSRYPLN